jgi:hypothetical protein
MHPTSVGDWAWSLPLIALTVVIHVCGLALIGERVADVLMRESLNPRRFLPKFAVTMGCTSLFATFLHGTETAIWAAVYRLLDALPDTKSAMLYSLSASGSDPVHNHAPSCPFSRVTRSHCVLQSRARRIPFGIGRLFRLPIRIYARMMARRRLLPAANCLYSDLRLSTCPNWRGSRTCYAVLQLGDRYSCRFGSLANKTL